MKLWSLWASQLLLDSSPILQGCTARRRQLPLTPHVPLAASLEVLLASMSCFCVRLFDWISRAGASPGSA